MRILFAAAALAAALPACAQAQSNNASQDANGATAASPAAPAAAPEQSSAATPAVDSGGSARDGTTDWGLEPYVAVTAGYEWFDRQENRSGIPAHGQRFDGEIIKGSAGVNVPFRGFFFGAEANVAKGFRDLDWEYGGSIRAGIRPGLTGMIYVKGGYEWVSFGRHVPDTSHQYHDWTWGLGVEVGPKTLGLGNVGGVRFRAEMNTFGYFHSFQPTAGLVMHF